MNDSKWQINSYRAIGLAGKSTRVFELDGSLMKNGFYSKPRKSKGLEPSSLASRKQIRTEFSALLVSLPVVGLQTKRDELERAIYIRVIHTFGK